MAGSAHRTVPHIASPALATSRRSTHTAALPDESLHPQLALFGVAFVAFLALAVVTLAPHLAQQVHKLSLWATPPAQPTPILAPTQLDDVASYARAMRPDDALVQVKPGVFAKRSNVEGVNVDGHTVYYDVVPHQSFGPLRSGKVTESQVNVLARDTSGDALILVYTIK